MGRIYKVGTRTSPLALKQVEEVLKELEKVYPHVEVRVVGIDTYGDRDKVTPISTIEGTDFFTREIDEALLNGEIDFAVHSAKDMPDKTREGLLIAAVTSSISPYDVLVSKDSLKIDELPYGAKIGTSSARRKTQLKRYRGDFRIVDIRGNIGERLEKLYKSDLDAVLMAAAGLIRLGLSEKITQELSFDIMRPHVLQGALAIAAKTEDVELINMLRALDKKTLIEEGIEI
ncbi:MAG: hydroxymethylbilane synthase [Candidatus Omnitrophota bacterium]